jgi:magnesium transporter
MNFKYISELEWLWGNFTVVGIMFCIGFGMFSWFLKKGWFK